MAKLQYTDEIMTSITQMSSIKKYSPVKIRRELLEKYCESEVPTVKEIAQFIKESNAEKDKILEETGIKKELQVRTSAMLSAVADIDALKILADNIAMNKEMIEEAVNKNNVKIYSAKDLIAMQTNTVKMIEAYTNLMLSAQKYEIEDRKIREADEKGVSVGGADVKKALLELMQGNANIINSIDIPSLRESVEEDEIE